MPTALTGFEMPISIPAHLLTFFGSEAESVTRVSLVKSFLLGAWQARAVPLLFFRQEPMT